MRRALYLAICLLALGLSSCNNRSCDCCFDEDENFVSSQFDSDSLSQGFREAELRGAYAVRYASPCFTTALDTAYRQPASHRGSTGFAGFSATLNTMFPGATQPSSAYALVLPQLGRRYQLTDIEVAGERRGNRCCKCYVNTRKRLRLDGVYLVADGQFTVAVLRR